MSDPRSRNRWPEAASVSQYLEAYQRVLREALGKVPAAAVEAAFARIAAAIARGARIYVAGNGGSASISSHFCCDWMKGAQVDGEPPVLVHSLSENPTVLTALANDMGFEHCFAEQVRILGQAGDLLVLISSSGNSPNVVRAARTAHEKRMEVIALTGFSGGELHRMADAGLHVPVDNYGIVEDAHQMLMHVLSQYLYLNRAERKSPPADRLIPDLSS